MANYIELIVPIYTGAEWFKALKCVMRGMMSRKDWNSEHFHITVAFMNGDNYVPELKETFAKVLSGRKAFSLTLDKLDVFEARRTGDYVIYIDASNKPEELNSLIHDLRAAAEGVGAKIEDFKFHITLGQKNMPGVKIETIQNAIAKIVHTPSFSLPINKVEYRYQGRSHSTSLIKSWSLDE